MDLGFENAIQKTPLRRSERFGTCASRSHDLSCRSSKIHIYNSAPDGLLRRQGHLVGARLKLTLPPPQIVAPRAQASAKASPGQGHYAVDEMSRPD
jgi:hypothetical protein